MSELKTKIINEIIRIEGGYINDPSDSGGETKYGITKGVARLYGYTGPIKNLSKETAFEIYSKRYWDALHLDAVEDICPFIAEELADTGVNMGVGRAAEFLQRSLNVLNNGGAHYPDLKVDGDLGPRTLAALRSYKTVRGSEGLDVLLTMLNCLQGAFYVTLAERRVKDEKFIFGWFKNRVA